MPRWMSCPYQRYAVSNSTFMMERNVIRPRVDEGLFIAGKKQAENNRHLMIPVEIFRTFETSLVSTYLLLLLRVERPSFFF